MGDTSQTLFTTCGEGEENNGGEEEECGDVEVWETLSSSFTEVQRVLDHNRSLIQQANDNHQSMVPRNLCKNVELIREINGNISRVVGLYSSLTSNFTNVVQQRRTSKDANREPDATKN